MMKYLVLSRRTPEFRGEVLGEHYAFLDRLRDAGRLECAGPFTDQSGGAYILIAASLDEAKQFAFKDPLHTQGCSQLDVFEWNVD